MFTFYTLEDFKESVFDGTSINDQFKDIISKIGENIILNKIQIIQNKDNDLISEYIHNNYRKNIGKIAVVLKTKVNKIDEEVKQLGKNLCMHIAASKPLALDIENLDPELIKKEEAVQLETIRSSGKPENIIDKILIGKMKKFYSESTFLNQLYILDTDKTIKDILKDFSQNNQISILDYQMIFFDS